MKKAGRKTMKKAASKSYEMGYAFGQMEYDMMAGDPEMQAYRGADVWEEAVGPQLEGRGLPFEMTWTELEEESDITIDQYDYREGFIRGYDEASKGITGKKTGSYLYLDANDTNWWVQAGVEYGRKMSYELSEMVHADPLNFVYAMEAFLGHTYDVFYGMESEIDDYVEEHDLDEEAADEIVMAFARGVCGAVTGKTASKISNRKNRKPVWNTR